MCVAEGKNKESLSEFIHRDWRVIWLRMILQALPLCWKEIENVGGFNNILACHNNFRSRFAWIWCPGKRSLLIVSSFLKNTSGGAV